MNARRTSEQQEFSRWYLRSKIRQLMAVQGDEGVAVKTALLTGLFPEEQIYLYSQQICNNHDCSCPGLHLIDKENGLTAILIGWFRAKKRTYFALSPTALWIRFRALTSFNQQDIKLADDAAREKTGVEFKQIRKIFFDVMRQTMSSTQLQILNGSARAEVAQYCLENEMDLVTANYVRGWQQVGLILPVV